ncbi:MAG TPA: hypothetical protein ENL09_02585 [Bacteroidetes bacterium]|nr:hypothetical protein [Bacteroidota bacterium]
MSKLIFHKEYCGEDLNDIEEDIYSAIIDANLPKDEYNFEQGEFRLTLKWFPNDDDNSRNVDNPTIDNGC